MDVDITQFQDTKPAEMRKEVHKRRNALLMGSAENAEENRAECLKTDAKERAKAKGDEDWEK